MRVLLVGAVASADRLAECLAPAVVDSAASGRAALQALREGVFGVVVADANALEDIGAEPEVAFGRLARHARQALMLATVAGGSVSARVALLRAGAHDCIEGCLDETAIAERICMLATRLGRAIGLGLAPAGDPVPSAAAAATMMVELRSSPPVLPMWLQEQRIIEQTVSLFAGNIAMAAAALEISPSTIYRKRQGWAEMRDPGSSLTA